MILAKKINFFILISACLLLTVCSQKVSALDNKDLKSLVREFRFLIELNKGNPEKIKPALDIERQAKKAKESGDSGKAAKLLKKAIFVLQEQKPKKDYSSGEVSQDSPFGIHDPTVLMGPVPPGMTKPDGIDEPGDIAELGARWVRYAGPTAIVWGGIEKEMKTTSRPLNRSTMSVSAGCMASSAPIPKRLSTATLTAVICTTVLPVSNVQTAGMNIY